MAQFRNITDETLWVMTDQGAIEVAPDSILTVSDEFATAVYFQTGEHNEPAIWEAVSVPSKSKKSPITDQPEPVAEEKE